ncbi:MAG: NUDIX domain-containing protein [Chloroflexi bacterium]|nr:MAG: NUDIX domain-containing protein [Chloroflexota bacterium]
MEKVAAFITRDVEVGGVWQRELLVFRHANPLAGVQVPAGTVDPPESPLAAVMREVAEEAGLLEVEVVGEPVLARLELLDAEWYLTLHGEGRAMLSEHDLASPVVTIVRRDGDRVLLGGSNPDGSAVEWWASASAVTRDLRRWLFHLRATGDVLDSWSRAFDRTEPWSFYWVALDAPSPLVGVQFGWFEEMRERLVAGRDGS